MKGITCTWSQLVSNSEFKHSFCKHTGQPETSVVPTELQRPIHLYKL